MKVEQSAGIERESGSARECKERIAWRRWGDRSGPEGFAFLRVAGTCHRSGSGRDGLGTKGCAGASFAEALVLRQGGDRRERLSALVALDLKATSYVHALMPTQVGELCVGFEADLAAKRLDAAVDVRVLFQAR